MGESDTVAARVGDRTKERLEEYAEKEGISRSKAIDRLVTKGLDLEDEALTDGGEVKEQLDTTQSNLNALSEKVDQVISGLKGVVPGIMLGLTYIIAEVSVGIPGTILPIGSGLGVLAILIYGYIQMVANERV